MFFTIKSSRVHGTHLIDLEILPKILDWESSAVTSKPLLRFQGIFSRFTARKLKTLEGLDLSYLVCFVKYIELFSYYSYFHSFHIFVILFFPAKFLTIAPSQSRNSWGIV